MDNLQTIYTSNIPVNCHIKKGRLESSGIKSYIFDENIVSVHPFYATAVAGVKLKVGSNNVNRAKHIFELIDNDLLTDTDGEYELKPTLIQSFNFQEEILKIKVQIRNKPALLNNTELIKSAILNDEILNEIIAEETNFQRIKNRRLNFNMKQFFYELFDFDRSVFNYLSSRPVEYYLDKDITDKYQQNSAKLKRIVCPTCNSENICFGFAIDFKWDIIYFIFSFLISPLPLIRKKFHCFECGKDFARNQIKHQL